MKKSIFVLSLLMPTIAYSQSPVSTNTITATGTSTLTSTATSTSTSTATSTATNTNASTSAKQEPSLKGVSSCDLADAKLTLGLTAEQINITGSLPKECADRLTLSDIQRNAPSKSADELKDAVLEKSEELKDYSTSVQIQVTYSSDDKNPSIRDCLKNYAASEMVDLSKDPRFARTVALSPELMIAGIIGEPMALKSPEYIKMEKEIQKLDCKDCNANWKLLSAHLKEARGFDSPLLTSMMNKLFESALIDLDKKIEDAKSLPALEQLRNQLVEMGSFSTTDEQRGSEKFLFTRLIEKNDDLANTGFKTASMASHHVDFDKDTYTKMQGIPGLPEDQRDELKEKAASLAVGQKDRLQYLSKIDGDHPEVRKYLRDADQNQRNLQTQMQNACMGRMNQYKFTQCSELQNQYNVNQQSTSDLRSRFTLADNQNWNGIFAYWDKKNIPYDQSLRTNFINPVTTTAPFAPNSLPMMYDPKDKRYQNFDPSKLYQTNAVMPEMNPLFSVSPYSITPVIR